MYMLQNMVDFVDFGIFSERNRVYLVDFIFHIQRMLNFF